MNKYCLLLLFTIAVQNSKAQTGGPVRVTTVAAYKKNVEADALKQMTDLKKLIPGIVLDLRYATRNNFTRHILYPWAKTTFMRLEAATALQKVQAALNKKGYGLKVFDAYRPWAATSKMWELVQDERYVANPARGSNHNRGLAVDLTLVYTTGNSEVNMGTGFDNFTDTAHHSFTQLPAAVLQHRKLLKETMEAMGFKAFDSEWWHYTWPDNRNYEILDIPLKKLWMAVR